jgi:F-type H+-transporting ATPase subunit a
MSTSGHHPSVFDIVPNVPGHVSSFIFVGLLLISATTIAAVQLRKTMKNAERAIVPDQTLSYRNFFEMIAEGLYKLCVSIMGEHSAHKFYPVMGSLFLLILTSNLLGLVPGFLSPTDNLNTTLALGLFVFIYYNFQGFKENGLGYLKQFAGPVWVLAPVLFFIELISHGVRPLSLGLRLSTNVSADHAVLGAFSELVPLGIPAIFYGVGIFVSLVQALVFCILTMVYISLSTSHEH